MTSPVFLNCDNCQTTHPLGTTYCPHCGHSLSGAPLVRLVPAPPKEKSIPVTRMRAPTIRLIFILVVILVGTIGALSTTISPTPNPTPIPVPIIIPTILPLPALTLTPHICIPWQQASDHLGTHQCICGRVLRTDDTDDAFYIFFSAETAFHLLSHDYYWDDLEGMCIQACGRITRSPLTTRVHMVLDEPNSTVYESPGCP